MKTEFEVGEVFQFGLVKLRCEKPTNNKVPCECCFFGEFDYSPCVPLVPILGECCGKYRKDKTDVIFKLVEE